MPRAAPSEFSAAWRHKTSLCRSRFGLNSASAFTSAILSSTTTISSATASISQRAWRDRGGGRGLRFRRYAPADSRQGRHSLRRYGLASSQEYRRADARLENENQRRNCIGVPVCLV